jgi:hypothetical protein
MKCMEASYIRLGNDMGHVHIANVVGLGILGEVLLYVLTAQRSACKSTLCDIRCALAIIDFKTPPLRLS